jgi:hypothetical protein
MVTRSTRSSGARKKNHLQNQATHRTKFCLCRIFCFGLIKILGHSRKTDGRPGGRCRIDLPDRRAVIAILLRNSVPLAGLS